MTLNIAPPDVQATFNFSGPTRSGRAATVIGFNAADAGTLLLIANHLSENWALTFMTGMHNSFTLESVTVVDNVASAEAISPTTGARSGDLAPPNTSVLLRKSTALRGRKFQGRSYIPGMLNDGDIYDTGAIAPTRIGQIQDYADTFVAACEADGLSMILLHPAPTGSTGVTSWDVQARVATQRKRLR